MELVELSSSTESSPMQNMTTPPRIEVNTPSGRVMRHCDPVSEVLLSQLTARFTFILQPLSLSVAEVSICPHFFIHIDNFIFFSWSGRLNSWRRIKPESGKKWIKGALSAPRCPGSSKYWILSKQYLSTCIIPVVFVTFTVQYIGKIWDKLSELSLTMILVHTREIFVVKINS